MGGGEGGHDVLVEGVEDDGVDVGLDEEGEEGEGKEKEEKIEAKISSV